uniref:C2H2-type domain-containing protein n=1 Tax=Romanomermis culicivorax TaxID=13658 RepID=A0A915L4B3_ROMCU
MVSTYQQYLYPDFLNSTSVDSNKSPLALLAQTCNSIGTTDAPSQAQGQKRKHSFDGNTSLSSATSSSASKTEKLAAGVADAKMQHDGGGHKNKVPKSSPHQADSTTSGDETSSGGASCSTSNCGQKETKNDKSAESSNNNSNQSHETAINDTTNSSLPSGQKMMPQMPPHSSTFLPNQTFNSLLNGTHPALGIGSSNPLLSGMSASAFFYPPTAMSHAGLNCIPGFPSTAALAAANPYYPSASSVASLYHHNPSRPCPTGCLQCATVAATHPFSMVGNDLTSWYQAYCSLLQPPQTAPPLPRPILPPTFNFAPPPTSATTPTCFWDTGDGRYCMKRFTNADEFSQHIKTHTEQLQKTSTPQTSPLQKPPSASPKNVAANVAAPTMSLPPPTLPSAYFNPLMHQYRYHPYDKFTNANDILMPPPTSLYNAAALMQQQQQSAAQQQRLPGSLPFP